VGHPRTVEAHQGTVEAQSKAVEAHLGAMEVRPKAVEAHPVFIKFICPFREEYYAGNLQISAVFRSNPLVFLFIGPGHLQITFCQIKSNFRLAFILTGVISKRLFSFALHVREMRRKKYLVLIWTIIRNFVLVLF
jgi:hypothetical protein